MAIDIAKIVEDILPNGDSENKRTEQKTSDRKLLNGHIESDPAATLTDHDAVNGVALNGDAKPESVKKDSDAEKDVKSKPIVRYDE